MTMKKIFRYVILLILVYVVVEVFVHFMTKAYYKDFNNYSILVDNPKIEITESKIAKNKGYIQGKVTNTTEELLKNVNIDFIFYNENNNQIGIENKTIEIFNVGEEVKFEVKFEYKDVEKIKINIRNEE